MIASVTSRARCKIVLAGVLWSLSGFFVKALSESTPLGLHEPKLDSAQIAFFRAAFAGIALAPFLRTRAKPPFDRRLLGMVACFATMSMCFVSAMTLGTAASAILLQYTAPLWLLMADRLWLGERADARDWPLLIGGISGVGILMLGGGNRMGAMAIGLALTSGITYAGVVLFLRVQRGRDPTWLAAANMFGTALLLLPFVIGSELPRGSQLAWLALFGVVQLAVPYWLMAQALQHVTSFEAGLLTLVEPLLNPVWAFLISPQTERPNIATLVGGGLILGGLLYRYWPAGSAVGDSTNPSVVVKKDVRKPTLDE